MVRIVLDRRNSPDKRRRVVKIDNKEMSFSEFERTLSVFLSLFESTYLEIYLCEKRIVLENKKYEVKILVENESFKRRLLSFAFREKRFEEFLPTILELISEAKELSITRKEGGE